MTKILVLAVLGLLAVSGQAKLKLKPTDKTAQNSALDQYVREATSRYSGGIAPAASPGSLWSPSARLNDVARDLKASQVDDIVTITVSETTSAVSSGTTKTSRASSAKNSILALAGSTTPAGRLANLASLSGQTDLNGTGTTSRTTTLNTTLTARVVTVLPNGYLVVEGTKLLGINSEHQVITVRGVVRPTDLASNNAIPSDHLAELEVLVNGKGVVADAVKRPMFLYRLLLGLLPF